MWQWILLIQACAELDKQVLFFTLIGIVLKYHIKSPIMPIATQKSACEKHNLSNEKSEVPSSPEETAISDQEID